MWARREVERNPIAIAERVANEPPLAGTARPLFGLYRSDDPRVAEWHVKLAQNAGIDAFLVSWWGQIQQPDQNFERGILAAAEKLGCKLALLDGLAQYHDNLEDCQRMLARTLRKYKDSPAYLRIDGFGFYSTFSHFRADRY